MGDTLIGKLLKYACVPDPEHAKFSSTEAYAWEPVSPNEASVGLPRKHGQDPSR